MGYVFNGVVNLGFLGGVACKDKTFRAILNQINATAQPVDHLKLIR